ncbi:MAG: thioredoxin family protein [Burkholderiales bacterium]|nr:thioredoxin family protein [Burkholderiales bacterium]
MTIAVEIFSAPGCTRCARARGPLKTVVEALGANRATWREVDVLAETDYAVALGVVATPAIAIDGRLAFAALPSPQRLRAELVRRLARDSRGG